MKIPKFLARIKASTPTVFPDFFFMVSNFTLIFSLFLFVKAAQDADSGADQEYDKNDGSSIHLLL